MRQNWFFKTKNGFDGRLFKKNKRGYYSFLLFAAIFFLTFFAEIIANDKPIILRFRGDFYFPIFHQKIPDWGFFGFRVYPRLFRIVPRSS